MSWFFRSIQRALTEAHDPALPPGFEGFGFDEPTRQPAKRGEEGAYLEKAKRDDIVQVGRVKFKVLWPHGIYVSATKAGTSGRKLYDITPLRFDSNETAVWEINGSGKRIKQVLTGPGKIVRK